MAKIDLRKRRVWLPALIALALVGLMVFRVIEASSPEEAPPTIEQIRAEDGMPVTIATADLGIVRVLREFNGTVSGAREAMITARSGDQISAVPVSVGDRVAAGAVLVRQTGEGTAARFRQAQAAQNQANRTVERLRPLHEAGAISDQDWEQALTQLELASADVAAAGDVLTLTSPIAGTVTEVTARPGMIPNPGDQLVRVADLSQLVVYLRVSATEAAGIQEGQRARIPTGAEGQVRRVALQADPATRLVEVEIAFPPSAGLIPGTLATVQIEIASREGVLRVPREAVRDGGTWVVDEQNRVTRREVQVGLESRDGVEILAGLEAGDRVVVSGGSLLSSGALVRVVSTVAEEG